MCPCAARIRPRWCATQQASIAMVKVGGRGVWCGGGDCERNGSCCFLFAGAASQTVAFKFDAVSVVNDAAQYCVTESWIRDNVVPLRHEHLTCDQQRSLIVAIIDDFEQIAALVGGERLGSPVVNDNEIGALERGH